MAIERLGVTGGQQRRLLQRQFELQKKMQDERFKDDLLAALYGGLLKTGLGVGAEAASAKIGQVLREPMELAKHGVSPELDELERRKKEVVEKARKPEHQRLPPGARRRAAGEDPRPGTDERRAPDRKVGPEAPLQTGLSKELVAEIESVREAARGLPGTAKVARIAREEIARKIRGEEREEARLNISKAGVQTPEQIEAASKDRASRLSQRFWPSWRVDSKGRRYLVQDMPEVVIKPMYQVSEKRVGPDGKVYNQKLWKVDVVPMTEGLKAQILRNKKYELRGDKWKTPAAGVFTATVIKGVGNKPFALNYKNLHSEKELARLTGAMNLEGRGIKEEFNRQLGELRETLRSLKNFKGNKKGEKYRILMHRYEKAADGVKSFAEGLIDESRTAQRKKQEQLRTSSADKIEKLLGLRRVALEEQKKVDEGFAKGHLKGEVAVPWQQDKWKLFVGDVPLKDVYNAMSGGELPKLGVAPRAGEGDGVKGKWAKLKFLHEVKAKYEKKGAGFHKSPVFAELRAEWRRVAGKLSNKWGGQSFLSFVRGEDLVDQGEPRVEPEFYRFDPEAGRVPPGPGAVHRPPGVPGVGPASNGKPPGPGGVPRLPGRPGKMPAEIPQPGTDGAQGALKRKGLRLPSGKSATDAAVDRLFNLIQLQDWGASKKRKVFREQLRLRGLV